MPTPCCMHAYLRTWLKFCFIQAILELSWKVAIHLYFSTIFHGSNIDFNYAEYLGFNTCMHLLLIT